MSLRDSVLLLPSTVFLVYFYCCFCFHQQNIWVMFCIHTRRWRETRTPVLLSLGIHSIMQLYDRSGVFVLYQENNHFWLRSLFTCTYSWQAGRTKLAKGPEQSTQSYWILVVVKWAASCSSYVFFFTCVTGFSLNAMYTLVWLADCTALSILENTVM